MISAGGVVVVILQAFVLGNQWVVEWVFERDILDSGFGAYLRSVLLFPHWRLTPGGSFSSMLVTDFGLLVLFVLLAAFTTVGLMTLDPTRGAAGAFICGWWATFLAAAGAAFVTQVLSGIVLDFPAFIRLAVANGLEYGLAAGWVPGVAVMAAYLLTRPGAAPGWVSGGPGAPAGA